MKTIPIPTALDLEYSRPNHPDSSPSLDELCTYNGIKYGNRASRNYAVVQRCASRDGMATEQERLAWLENAKRYPDIVLAHEVNQGLNTDMSGYEFKLCLWSLSR